MRRKPSERVAGLSPNRSCDIDRTAVAGGATLTSASPGVTTRSGILSYWLPSMRLPSIDVGRSSRGKGQSTTAHGVARNRSQTQQKSDLTTESTWKEDVSAGPDRRLLESRPTREAAIARTRATHAAAAPAGSSRDTGLRWSFCNRARWRSLTVLLQMTGWA